MDNRLERSFITDRNHIITDELFLEVLKADLIHSTYFTLNVSCSFMDQWLMDYLVSDMLEDTIFLTHNKTINNLKAKIFQIMIVIIIL